MQYDLESILLFRSLKKIRMFCKKKSIWWAICLLPAFLLFLFNILEHTLFSSAYVNRGLIEDFPAVWTLIIGLLFLPSLFIYYLPVVSILYENLSKKWPVFYKHLINFTLSFISILASICINKTWINSQLSDDVITWFSHKGFLCMYDYNIVATDCSESFNLGGIFYALICLYFWYLMVTIALLLLCSFLCLFVLSFNNKRRSQKHKEKFNVFNINHDTVHKYLFLSTSYIFLLIFYYLMLQFNELTLDGTSAFSLHPMRFLFLMIVLALFVIYLYITSLLLSFSKPNISIANKLSTCEKINTHTLFLFGFCFLTVLYAVIMKFMFANANYDFKLAVSFCFFLFFVIIAGIGSISNWKRTKLLVDFYEENKFLAHYSNTVDDIHLEAKQYRHDFKNILLGMKSYIDDGDLANIKNYYYNEILKNTPEKSKLYSQIDIISAIPLPELKGLLLTKLNYADSLNVTVSFEIVDFPNYIDIPISELCRLVGILMDNALEAAAESNDKKVIFSVGNVSSKSTNSFNLKSRKRSTVYSEIAIGNSFDILDYNTINSMFEPGFSTKGYNRGLGLSYVRKATNKYPSLNFVTDTDGKWISQKICLCFYSKNGK